MARSAQIIRQWRILRYLSENPTGCQVEELVRVFSTEIRTVYRDLAALQEAGFPVWSQRLGKIAIWFAGEWWNEGFTTQINTQEVEMPRGRRKIIRLTKAGETAPVKDTGNTGNTGNYPINDESFQKGRIIERFVAAAAGLGFPLDYVIERNEEGVAGYMSWNINPETHAYMLDFFPEGCSGLGLESVTEKELRDFFREALQKMASEWV